MALLPSRIGKYRVERRLGEGGMGTVYLAHDEGIDRYVAIKLLRGDDEELRKRFRSEARLAGRLKHPSIVTVHEFTEFEGDPCIVMEYVEGRTLADLIHRKAPVPEATKLHLIEQVCRGLAYAHRAGIVHRDIKPSNLMLDSEGGIKIVDFGIARTIDRGPTITGHLVGTLAYMAPEQVRGEGVDRRTDVFALGLVLYEFLTGARAFQGDSDYAIFNRIATGEPEPFQHPDPVVSALMKPIFDTALAKDPDRRFQDADRFAEALAAARAQLDRDEAKPAVPETAIVTRTVIVAPLAVPDTTFSTPAPRAEVEDEPTFKLPSAIDVPTVRQDEPVAATPTAVPPESEKAPALIDNHADLPAFNASEWVPDRPYESDAQTEPQGPASSSSIADGRWRPKPWAVALGLVAAAIAGEIYLWTTTPSVSEPAATETTPASSVATGTATVARRAGETRSDPRVPGLQWAFIPAGTFEMGCTPGDTECYSDESPRHRVVFTEPYEMMTTEVAVAMPKALGRAPSGQPKWSGDDHPLVYISWDEAVSTCQLLGGRLPTEAEWEDAARGGAAGAKYPWGNEAPVATTGTRNGSRFSGGSTIPVASYAPNGYGLYDMAGNASEWVADWSRPYVPDAQTDPLGPVSGSSRVLRGGSWLYSPGVLRVSYRGYYAPSSRFYSLGVRCARDVSP